MFNLLLFCTLTFDGFILFFCFYCDFRWFIIRTHNVRSHLMWNHWRIPLLFVYLHFRILWIVLAGFSFFLAHNKFGSFHNTTSLYLIDISVSIGKLYAFIKMVSSHKATQNTMFSFSYVWYRNLFISCFMFFFFDYVLSASLITLRCVFVRKPFVCVSIHERMTLKNHFRIMSTCIFSFLSSLTIIRFSSIMLSFCSVFFRRCCCCSLTLNHRFQIVLKCKRVIFCRFLIKLYRNIDSNIIE